MPDWNLECEIKIRALEALKENLDKEIDELINICLLYTSDAADDVITV